MENLTVNTESLQPLNHTNYELLKTETDLVNVKEVKDLIKSLKQRSQDKTISPNVISQNYQKIASKTLQKF